MVIEGSLACHTYCDTGHTFIINGHLRGPVTLTPNAEQLAVELSLSFFTTDVCRGWDSNTQPSACGVKAVYLLSFICAYFHSSNGGMGFSNTLKRFYKVKWYNEHVYFFYITGTKAMYLTF